MAAETIPLRVVEWMSEAQALKKALFQSPSSKPSSKRMLVGLLTFMLVSLENECGTETGV